MNFLQLDDIMINGVDIKVVRDDIFPFVGGGSKARKALEYESYLRQHNYNAIVTCGGIQSNHNRAMALLCAHNRWKCHLCIQGEKERFYKEKGNALLDRLSGAECEMIAVNDTSIAMDRAMKNLIFNGWNPFYVIGGGHNLPGGTSFVKAIKLLFEKCLVLDYKPDYIFLPSGTGSTQAGIVVGLDLIGWNDVQVVGISVARQRERGTKAVVDFANDLAKYYGLNKDYSDSIIFNSDYLLGGYEKYSIKLYNFLSQMMKETGLIFDATYSGKGLWGMCSEIKKNHLENKKILFWHTGGLMNLLK